MTLPKKITDFSKFLSYILERNPDEFGLAPDENGYIKVKELLKAIREEEGFKHVNQGLINELLLSIPGHSFELNDLMIRSKNREKLPIPVYAETVPNTLYIAITRKSHQSVLSKGIFPSHTHRVVMSSDKNMALRIGMRKDPKPVLVTINSTFALDQGVFFYECGELLYLARHIPTGVFTAPPLPSPKKDKAEKSSKQGKKTTTSKKPPLAGSFFVDPEAFSENTSSKLAGKSDKWKDNKKKFRRQQRRLTGKD